MSCPDELTWSIYADDELEGEALRGAEMHLVGCRDCRRQVVALQDEAAAIKSALIGRSSAPAPLRARPETDSDLAWGVPVAIATVTMLIAVVSVLIEMRLPGVLDLLNPRRLMGVYEMAFDSVFMLRDRLPVLFDLATSVAGFAAVSALGCAAVHALSQRLTKSSTWIVLGLLAVSAPDAAQAVDIRRNQDTHIGSDEKVDESLVCTGDVVTIDGTVDGNLFVAAERVILRGLITGDVFVFGGEVEIDGVIEGSLLVAGEQTRLGARVDGSVTLAGERATIADEARIGRDTALFGEGARIEGEAARDVTFAGEWIEIRGAIGRDLHILAAERIVLLDRARIARDIRARLHEGHYEIDQAPGATVGGETLIETTSLVREHYLGRYREPGYYGRLLVSAAAAFLFGLCVYLLDPRIFSSEAPNARGFLRSLGTGFVVVLAGPIVFLLIGMTIVGLPIAGFGLFLLLFALYTAYVLVGGLVGQRLLPPTGPGLGRFAPSLLVGILVVTVAAALPFVGPAVRIVAVLFGLGYLIERVRGVHELNLRGVRVSE